MDFLSNFQNNIGSYGVLLGVYYGGLVLYDYRQIMNHPVTDNSKTFVAPADKNSKSDKKNVLPTIDPKSLMVESSHPTNKTKINTTKESFDTETQADDTSVNKPVPKNIIQEKDFFEEMMKPLDKTTSNENDDSVESINNKETLKEQTGGNALHTYQILLQKEEKRKKAEQEREEAEERQALLERKLANEINPDTMNILNRAL